MRLALRDAKVPELHARQAGKIAIIRSHGYEVIAGLCSIIAVRLPPFVAHSPLMWHLFVSTTDDRSTRA